MRLLDEVSAEYKARFAQESGAARRVRCLRVVLLTRGVGGYSDLSSPHNPFTLSRPAALGGPYRRARATIPPMGDIGPTPRLDCGCPSIHPDEASGHSGRTGWVAPAPPRRGPRQRCAETRALQTEYHVRGTALRERRPASAFTTKGRDLMMPQPLAGKHVALGVTGSIACHKAVDLASKLTQSGRARRRSDDRRAPRSSRPRWRSAASPTGRCWPTCATPRRTTRLSTSRSPSGPTW